MSLEVFMLVLLAAALHAAWNAIIKRAEDTFASTVAICIGASVFALIVLPFIRQPQPDSWPHLGASMILQTVYFTLVAMAYRHADMSVAYPVMRGGAPMIVAVASALLLEERLSLPGWLGILLISGGILILAVSGRRGTNSGLIFAVANACVIATYTLNDGAGARVSEAPLGYSLWVSVVTTPPVLAGALWLWGGGFVKRLAACWRQGVIGGLGTLISYSIALWAMTLAPIAVVAALRETSILFAAIIAIVLLGERMQWRRIVMVLLIAIGAALLRLA